MRITDAWLTLPSLVFAILLSSVRGPGLWNVVLILAAGVLEPLLPRRPR